MPLPPRSIFTYAASFEPADAQFDQPVTLRVKNTLGFPPGTPIPIGFYNKETGEWEPVGMGEVVGDGEWSEYTIERFSWYDLNLAWTPPLVARSPSVGGNDTPPSSGGGGECPEDTGSSVGIRSGALSIEHQLPSLRRLGTQNSLTLNYNSITAYPTLLFATQTDLAQTTMVPETSGFVAELEGVRREVKFEGVSGEVTQRVLLETKNARGKTLPTGMYLYQISLSNDYQVNFATTSFFGGPPLNDTGIPAPTLRPYTSKIGGNIVVNNQIDSPLGAGWALDGLQRLYPGLNGDYFLTEGNGSTRIFRKKGTYAYAGGDSLYIIDTSTNTAIGTIPDIYSVREVAITPDNRFAYVISYGSNIVSVIDTSTHTVVGTIPVGSSPKKIAITPDNRFAYVTDPGNNTVCVLDTSTNTVIGTIPVGSIPTGIAITGDGRFAYVANCNSNNVSCIDTSTNMVVATIPTDRGPGSVITSPDSRFAYVSHNYYHYDYISRRITSAKDISVIDTSTNTIVATILTEGWPAGMAITPDGKFIYVAYGAFYSGPQWIESRSAAVVDTSINAVVSTISVGSTPGGVAITPDGRYAYVIGGHPFLGSNISVIDTSINGVVEAIPIIGHTIATVTTREEGFVSLEGGYSTLVKNPDSTYTRTMKDGTKHHFNEEGLHISTIDRNGNTTTYTYDEQDRLISIADPVGQITTLSYDGDHVSTITDPAGRITRLYHDQAGNLLQITNPDGTSRSFTYNSDHLLTSKTDERGNTTQYIYDTYGRISETHSPEHEVLKDGNLIREVKIR